MFHKKKKINWRKIVSRDFFFQAVQTPHLFFKIELKEHDQYMDKGITKTRIIWFLGVVAIQLKGQVFSINMLHMIMD